MPDDTAIPPMADSWLYHFPNLYRAHRLYPLGCRWCMHPLTFTAWGWLCGTCDVPVPVEGKC